MREPLCNEILALYAAITDDNHWRSALWGICAQLDASGMGLLYGNGAGAVSAIASAIPEAEIDAIRSWLSAPAPPESGLRDTSQTKVCPHWLLPGVTTVAGLSGRHLVARLDHDGKTAGYTDLYREPGAPEFDATAIESFVILAPHLARALALALRVAAAEACARRCEQCSDMLPFGCVLLDHTGSVIEMNRAASEMLDSGDGLSVADNRLRATRADDDEALGRRLGEVLGSGSAPGAAFVSVPRPSGRSRYVIFMGQMTPIRSAFALRAPRVRLVIVDTDRGNYVPREVVQALYELTESESWVAWHLAGGDTLEQAAQRLGIAHNTLRHHLERVFAKTGAHRQSDLARLVQAPFVSISGMT